MIKKNEVKKEYYDAVELTLKCYPILLSHIEELKRTLNEIALNDGVRGISYDGIASSTNAISRIIENTAIGNIEDALLVKCELEKLHSKVNRIQLALESLSSNECTILKERYINLKKWKDISDLTNYHRNQCMTLHNNGVAQLAVVFYGVKVLVDGDMLMEVC